MATLAHELHVLVGLMDRRAELLLARSGVGLTYRRFLALLHVDELDGPTQRGLAERLGSSEAATSRMVAGLVRDGLLDATSAGGNRRTLRLTPEGGRRLAAAGGVLGDRFDGLVRSRGADPDALLAVVTDLVAALSDLVHTPGTGPRSADGALAAVSTDPDLQEV
ncbi:MarR family winged helix-turn-helix transcriptional regulator [Phycicoccus flavus]|uniref:MarR family transcriptional regulator n=1 Tax=Phycicoccus flavus TaxID=2502783 RepID=A0A8T6QYQ2_9MICO|nr:MarR family transcriptional regulator [Phycicoccus flavus]NHA66727.1 MarR family transcriptional regulator [Phycicoccus flavus]